MNLQEEAYINYLKHCYDVPNDCEDDPDCIILHVKVKDTGIGIKPEDMEKLFSKFERIEEKRNRNIEGTGLGMTITKNLLDMMGSYLQVESTYGVGSHLLLRFAAEGWQVGAIGRL